MLYWKAGNRVEPLEITTNPLRVFPHLAIRHNSGNIKGAQLSNPEQTMTQTPTRPSVDIQEDIRSLIAHYPPLQADRFQLNIDVENGVVKVSGHVRSAITRTFFAQRAAEIPGVVAVNVDALYSEETIRLEAGQRIPTGVIANATYGTLVLTGALPEGETSEAVAQSVGQIPGVRRVITKFQA